MMACVLYLLSAEVYSGSGAASGSISRLYFNPSKILEMNAIELDIFGLETSPSGLELCV